MATILLLHGALGTARQMAPLAAQLGDHHVLMPTLSGHGEKAGSALDFELFLQDIDVAIAGTSGPVHILGYSMGGYAALLFAARHPERIASVCTVATKYIWTPEGLAKEVRKLDPDVLEQKVPQFAQTLAAEHGPNWKELVRSTADLMRRLASEPLLTDDVLSAVECPVLLCVGDRDTTAVPEDTLYTARKLRKAATWVMPWTKHPFEEVDPADLAAKFNALITL
jgi:pimeloyl-ACP methyl ester carboxylesterase